MKEQRGEEVKIFLVGNKADLDGSKTEKRVVKLRGPRLRRLKTVYSPEYQGSPLNAKLAFLIP